MTKRIIVLFSSILFGMMVCGSANAAPVWICSIVDAVAVDEDGTVGPPDLLGLEHPTFIQVDLGAEKVTILGPDSRAGEVTHIDRVEKVGDLWLIAGVEAIRAWSMVISESGHLTISITVDGGTWSIFGNALRQDDPDGK